MALTNAEKQARWREKHIVHRRTAQRFVNLLVRQNQTDEHIVEMADLLATFFNREGIRTLRRRLREVSEPDEGVYRKQRKEHARHFREMWLAEHPGCTAKDFNKLSGDERGEWRQAQQLAAVAAEKEDWERDHPGEVYPMFEDGYNCGLSGREQTDMDRWRRDRARRQRRAAK